MAVSNVSARMVNPEAGEHMISSEPLFREAAENASRKSWREFPYYPKRYGERGYRFSLSDTGWLTTLLGVPPAEAKAQIEWLTRVLASRGMPSYLMERHLAHLHAELAAAQPADADRFAVLERCALTLRERRLARLSEEQFRDLARGFEQACAASGTRVGNVGVVLVAAVADEAAGLDNAVDSLHRWATDAARFDAAWTGAVEETLLAARAAVAQSAPVV